MQLALAVLALLGVVALVVSAPLTRRAKPTEQLADERRAGLEAARDAKYREIRDAQLDFSTGKLSADDHRALDAELRGEAIAILRELDAPAEG
jgi:hypothetical protein